MRLLRSICALLAGVILFNCNAVAQTKQTCTNTEEAQAETSSDFIESWDGLYSAYKLFSKCDDGGAAEGFSDVTGRLFIESWKELPRLNELMRKDAGFKRFVFSHLDDTLPADELHTIQDLSKSNCPTGLDYLCAQIGKAAVGS